MGEPNAQERPVSDERAPVSDERLAERVLDRETRDDDAGDDMEAW